MLVTRPVHQAETLCGLIESAGGQAVRFPLLEIVDPLDPGPLLKAIDRLEDYDIAVFISQNAVTRTLTKLRARREIPADLQFAAVGRGTARELLRSGIRVDICPSGRFDSEALLAMPPMRRVSGQRVVVFRGDGGRELLGDTLRSRGATVDYIEAYRRTLPDTDVGVLHKEWTQAGIDAVILTSNMALQNLFELVGASDQHWLLRMPVLVLGERAAGRARQLGFLGEVLVAQEASDAGLVKALRHWRSGVGARAAADNTTAHGAAVTPIGGREGT